MSTITLHPGGIGSHAPGPRGRGRALVPWLGMVALLVFLMIVVGGITRLTESGLSMVDWRPVTGVLPPLDEAGWQEAFEAYKATPEYRIVNRGMTLEAFKSIFWWEYLHRLLGRLIGLAYAVPLAFFWVRRAIPRAFMPRLVGILLLGGLQGLMGWYMVRSGLVDEPEVSPLRLAAHLLLAFMIFGMLVWTALDLAGERGSHRNRKSRRLAKILVGLLLFQVVLGGLVAGLKAGLVFNDWPLMNGSVLPPGAFALAPWPVNFFENAALVQFNHRIVGYLLLGLGLAIFASSFARPAPLAMRVGAAGLLFVLIAQASSGVLALVNHVPIALGVLHQGGAALVLAAALLFLHAHRPDLR